ncbi:MAG: PAS domain-containing protein, partial [Muribaculaceae bacterium]|nr:PAS domain-containing protein [Muribaculaceae bacterium]
MNTRLLFIISSLLAIALGVMSIIGLPEHLKWWGVGIGAVLVVLLAAIYHSTIKPVIVARRGLEMLRSQDFNVRLMKVGTPEADKIVDLFNHLITKLKNERLRLREQDTFLHLLIDASPMGVIMVDLDERITMVNPALLKISGISKSDSPTGAKLQDVGSAIITHLA